MSCCQGQGDDEQRTRNKEIEYAIDREKVALESEIKMLLLGAGESGKSTILKQMKLIHDRGFSDKERETFRMIVFSNVVHSLRAILEAMQQMDIQLQDPENEGNRSVVMELPAAILESERLPSSITIAIKALWQDPGVKTAFARSREYQLMDSASYYFDAIDRIGSPDYLPNDQDVLRSRVKTTGIAESTFFIENLTYRMFDVGGQRSERRKWIHCFEKVTAIVFLVAISEYDQFLVEDASVNRIQESLALFDSICNSRWFTKTSMILFLNKIDLFKAKLAQSPLSNYFPEFASGDDYTKACSFMWNKFKSLNRSPTKEIYIHYTCATDTKQDHSQLLACHPSPMAFPQIQFVMDAINSILIQNRLSKAGLM
ncbi:guanine nucleotide-binding protein subunit alpha [Thoreauomyces humboldtii]|nr:guanine nucleotide-binding protein subunit alpha [Thoreauomyces humboldtii]